MEIGITITAELKAANSDLFKNDAVDSIRTANKLPNSFVSLVYNPGKRTDGYHTLLPPDPTHYDEGFREVVTPVPDPATEKLGAIFFDDQNDYFTYPVLSKTQEEQDLYTQQQEDNDDSANQTRKYKSDGEEGFDRAMALIQRRLDQDVITGAQAKGIAQGLYPSLEPLYKGLWQLVKSNLSVVPPPANPDLLDIFNTIKNGVDNYVTANFPEDN